MDGGVRIRRGGPWGLTDTLVGSGIYGLVVVSSISSYVHSDRSSIACASRQSSVVWG